MWGILTRRVYAHGKQYDNVRELEAAIYREWANIPQQICQTLTDSMKNRVFQVILKQGKFTR